MLPAAYIEHQIAGRMRVRIPQRRGDVAFFERAISVLSKLSGVNELDASPLTGSIRIRYTGAPEAIKAAAAKEELFEIGEPEREAEPKKPARQRHGEPGMLDTIATGLSGLAIFQVSQGQITGSAAENFWNAYGAQRLLGRKEVAAAFGVLGLYQLLQGQWLGSASSLFFYALIARQLAGFDRAASALTGRIEPPKPSGQPPKRPRKKRNPDKPTEKPSV